MNERIQRRQVESHILESFSLEPKYRADKEIWIEYHIECRCCHDRAKIIHTGRLLDNKYLRANLCPGCYEVRKELMERLLDPKGMFFVG